MVLGLRAGSERALDAAIEQYSRLLWSIARPILRNIGTIEDMEECVADAFIQLWQNRAMMAEDRGGVKSWLCTVVKCKAIDRYRKCVQKSEIGMNEQLIALGAGLFDQTLDAVLQRELLAAVHALGEPDHEILLRRYYYQQKPKDIACALDMTVRQVENRIFRAKLLLRNRLEGESV
ncbi:MAG: sigma-70 family RNA polymerase sigma factor [Christensenella sp.]|nr:sigma-70 family RNA polymerase sigma factor [Christensenella sp.]